ncbi:PKD domain-containing protein [Fulvivirgaceae bacterium PWU4]|uniref:PKD domain-containing protein n=1 Tax=Chryseosolibacter histidini TaxID=2782349 RepID=A0AAP2GLR9_9BACT|nr:PKD domain-containing protein [Chryseosolibacter histidini]MBT1696128.1 PKD domain-containing protein [Chryseosolibacter histidini]
MKSFSYYRYIWLCLLMLGTSAGFGQVTITNKGEQIYILNGANIYINGNYVNDAKYADLPTEPYLVHNGSLFISGDMTNNSPANLLLNPAVSSLGTIEFMGGGDKSINGGTLFRVYDLVVNKSSSNLVLNRDLHVTNKITFTSGKINLNGKTIDLSGGLDPKLVNESNASRIIGPGGGFVRYAVQATPFLADVQGNIGLRLEADESDIVIYRGHAVQTNAGDGSVGRFFDVVVNNGTVSKLEFHYFDDEVAGFTEGQLVPYISLDNGTTWRKYPGAVDQGNNYVSVTGLTFTSNFRITLAHGTCSAPPVVSVTAPTTDLCQGSSVVLNPGVSSAYYEWSTGATTETITVNTGGTYGVNVRHASGCDANGNIVITSRPNPVANFNFGGIICPGTNVAFTNATTIGSGGGSVSYSWDFGDPSTTTDNSTGNSPSYGYAVAGDYTVTLEAESQYQCTHTTTKTVTVTPFPLPGFSFSQVCLGQTTDFQNSSIIPAPYGMTYEWDFDDGSTPSTDENPLHAYSSMGTYDVKLTVTSNAGCVKDITETVNIYYTPVAGFTIDDACQGSPAKFTNSSTIVAGTLTYAWDFGDGTTGSGLALSKTYNAAGNFDVTLTATSEHNCSNTVIMPVQIYPKPIAEFSVKDDCQDQTFVFTNTSKSTMGTLTYSWDFDDGTTSTDVSPQNFFNNAGTYDVLLTAESSLGCKSTVTRLVTVHPMPVVNFSFANDCQDQNIVFNNGTTVSSGNLSYNWAFGDASTSNAVSPSKSYNTDGTYVVTLTATSDKDCAVTATQQVEIYPLPVVNFGGTIVTCGTSYTLDAGNAGSTYVWSNGSTNQSATFTADGNYSVTVTTAHGCIDVEAVNITLNGNVTPNLGADKVVCGGVVLDAGYPGGTYVWSNGSSARTLNAASTGIYRVTVTDQNNCVGSDEVFVTVNPVPVVDLGADIVVCANQPVTLDAANPGSAYRWSDNSTGRTLLVTSSGLYNVEVTNTFGCREDDQVSVTIHAMPVNNLPSAITVCDVVTLDAGNPGASYTWSNGTGNKTLEVRSSGTYTVNVSTPQSCAQQFTSNVTVNASPPVELGPASNLCFGQSAFLDAGNSGDTYQWSSGATSQTLMATTSGLYKVQVRRNNGCITRDSVQVTIYPQITHNLSASYPLCPNVSRTLNATSPQAVAYQWSAASGPVSTSPSITVSEQGKYWITLSNAVGCTRTDTVTVQGDPDPITARYLVSTFVDVGDSVRFVQLSYPDPVSYSWNFADGITSTKSNPVHIYRRPGDFNTSLVVADPNNCKDTMTKMITVRLLRDEGEVEIELPFVEMISSSLYPNPARDKINVGLEFNKEAEVVMVLYTMNGKVIEMRAVKLSNDVVEFDLRNVSSGLYILRIFMNNEVRSMRFVKL